MRRSLAVALVFAALVAMTGSARAAQVATAPGGFVAGFVPPVVVIAEGEGISYTNGDIAPHNFVADGAFLTKKAARKAKWCSGFNKGNCPIFWSRTIGLGETTNVLGLKRLRSGDQYGFLCLLHPNMKGTLVVR